MSNKISKRLSYILRHNPESIGITLNEQGWTPILPLINKLNISPNQLIETVKKDSKNRYEINYQKKLIRARQGHSVSVNLDYEYIKPPDILYHGTAVHNLVSIYESGINKASRHSVHMSTDKEMMLKVGKRHGIPVVIKINSGQMFKDGFKFQKTGNDVWLTDRVPKQYILRE